MNIKLYTGTRFLFCAMCIALIAACPMPEPEPTVPGTIGAPDLKAGNGQLTVNWTAPNNGGSEITTYHLHHSADGGTMWSEIIVLAAPAASYTITGLTNAAEYHVQARAVNAQGTGGWSESAVATLPAAATPSAAVPDAPAAPTLYAGTGRIVARWSEPDDNGSEITGYELIYREVGVTTWTAASGITGTDHTITGLTNGALYQVQMRAVNAVGAGPWSAPVTESPLFSPTEIPSGEEGSISLLAADNAIVTASIANENLNINFSLTTVEPDPLSVTGGDLKVTPATAPTGVTIPTVNASTGIVTVTTSTTAGKYLIYGETENRDILFAEYFYVTVSPTTNDELKAAVDAGISNWGNTADFNYIITAAVTDMSEIFKEKITFNGDISLWNTAAVTNMRSMFNSAPAFNGDISAWDTTAVTNMSAMFISARAFNGDISLWDVSSVTNIGNMFNNAPAFNGDISGWDVSSVTIMSQMFFGTSVFNANISGWNVSSVTDMSNMFVNATVFNQDLEEWKEHWTKVANKYTVTVSNMFAGSRVGRGQTNDVAFPLWYTEIIAY